MLMKFTGVTKQPKGSERMLAMPGLHFAGSAPSTPSVAICGSQIRGYGELSLKE